ncbi:hypothetical protein [uncultured Desulfovibrio sp.]|uniref:Uncharacterized protein n=1 Tax=Candidatus Desulfovibrio intestinavium TaxID=2838534 RepID=A0A9D2KQ48_9BACT|nr:hypothetical protein [uncultured Desulfovibrio sp.]HJA78613.1 hypothetical protein [Candidatus Desulfovibrio intestinavium]
MDGMQISGAQITENGTFMSTEELLDGSQPQADTLTALVINKTLNKQAELAAQLRNSAMHDMGRGQRLDTIA